MFFLHFFFHSIFPLYFLSLIFFCKLFWEANIIILFLFFGFYLKRFLVLWEELRAIIFPCEIKDALTNSITWQPINWRKQLLKLNSNVPFFFLNFIKLLISITIQFLGQITKITLFKQCLTYVMLKCHQILSIIKNSHKKNRKKINK